MSSSFQNVTTKYFVQKNSLFYIESQNLSFSEAQLKKKVSREKIPIKI